jgi:hypothetical protein
LALKILAPPKTCSHAGLVDAIMADEDCSEATAKRRIKDMIEYGFIKKNECIYRSIV